MPQQVLSVTQINEYIRTMIDSDGFLANLAIRGEISNYKLYPSGHHYFTLKDENAAIKCVMFRSNAARLRFKPTNGMKIIAIGKISAYPRDGVYQLYCASLVPDGIGDLHAAFEQLKDRLSKQGLFDPAHKKSLPKFPNRIAIITSSAGAAVHDMIRIIRKRFPLTKVVILPVRVQGKEAPPEIAAAIQYANQHSLADLLIVGRGGGSIEDLWAFNDERVAYAIFESTIPVISAVGHEPDVTISDFVADLRAATPSNAAELAVPDQDSLSQMLDSLSESMINAFYKQLKNARIQLSLLADSNILKTSTGYIEQRKNMLTLLKNRLAASQTQALHRNTQKYLMLTSKLDAMSPLKVLTRGYALVQSQNREVISSVLQLHSDETISVTFGDGTAKATIVEIKETDI